MATRRTGVCAARCAYAQHHGRRAGRKSPFSPRSSGYAAGRTTPRVVSGVGASTCDARPTLPASAPIFPDGRCKPAPLRPALRAQSAFIGVHLRFHLLERVGHRGTPIDAEPQTGVETLTRFATKEPRVPAIIGADRCPSVAATSGPPRQDRISLNEAVGHRGHGDKARDHREFGGKRAFRDTHPLGEHSASGFLNTKFFSVPSFHLSSASVTCPDSRV